MEKTARKNRVGIGISFALLICAALAFAHNRHTQDSPLKQPGEHWLTLHVGAWERKALVHTPEGYDGKKPLPVVLFLHGAGGSAENAAHDYGWEEKADREHFLAVFPQGLPARPGQRGRLLTNPNIWRDGRPEIRDRGVDDVAFLRQLLDTLEERGLLDARRLYVTGFSNGAGMTFHLGIVLSDRIAAIAPASSGMFDTNPSLTHPIPMLYITGTADPLNPIQGGTVRLPWGTTTQKPPIQKSIETWRRLLDCPPTPKSVRDSGGVRCAVYGPGQDNSEVVYYTIEGMGHHWPGSKERLPKRIVGPVSDPIRATDVIWAFFAKHPRRP